MTRTAQINLRTLSAVSFGASTEETRYYLQGVCVEIRPRDVLYTSTDGHMLISARETLDDDAPDNTLCGAFIVPTEVCRAFKAPKRATIFDATMSTDASGKLYLDYNESVRGFSPVDGTFPDWRRVLPSTQCDDVDELAVATFNPDLLVRIGKAAKALDLDVKPHVVPNGPNPAFVWFGDHCQVFAVVMPMRAKDRRAQRAPSWVSAPPAPAHDVQDAPDAPAGSHLRAVA